MKLSDLITPEDLDLAFQGRTVWAPGPDATPEMFEYWKSIRGFREVFKRVAGEGPMEEATMGAVFQMIDMAIRHATRGQAQ